MAMNATLLCCGAAICLTHEKPFQTSHLMEEAMLKEAHVGPQPVVCGRQLGAHLRRQLVQLQRPLAQREAAEARQNVKLILLRSWGMLPTAGTTATGNCTLDRREIGDSIHAWRAAHTSALP